MTHTHSHAHAHDHNNTTGNIKIAFFLNSIFVVIELIGGIFTNSIAILSDALHDFGDCLSLAVAWALQKKALKKRDKFYSYGYKRFSLLGSVFLSGVLFLSSVFVIIEAVKRIQDPQSVKAEEMLILAIVGVIINGAAALKLKKGDSLNEKAVFIHIMEDVLGWISVLIVSIVMMFVNIHILDPILSLAISMWVLFNVYTNLKATFRIFLQAIPDGVDIDELKKLLESQEDVDSIHDLHVWTMDGNFHVMTLHVVTCSNDKELLKEKLRTLVEPFKIKHITIEFENSNEHCIYNTL
ncbi:MAG: cation diffusion facilitator family transporter [Bacteroidales bacterium]|nr:cation diffusion facilitator family transporter [Bacteroidales bacterium]